MRITLALALLVLAPAALAHEGSHGIELVDLQLAFHPLGARQEFSFTLENDATAPTTNLEARVTVVGEYLQYSYALAPMAAGETRAFSVYVGLMASAYGCVQAVASHKASDVECAFLGGVVLA